VPPAATNVLVVVVAMLIVMVVAVLIVMVVAVLIVVLVVMVVAVLIVDHITHLPTPPACAPSRSAVEMPAEVLQAAVHLQRHDLVPSA